MDTVTYLNQFRPEVPPGPDYYSRVRSDNNGTYWDEVTHTLLPLPNGQPNIPFIEISPGVWGWTRDFAALPDGFYTIELWKVGSTTQAADARYLFIRDGADFSHFEQLKVPLSHNTGGADDLRYIDENGVPIVGATIRVYKSQDWQTQSRANPVGITFTNSEGRWGNPIFVSPGDTYYVQFHLEQKHGPDLAIVTV